MAIRTSIRAAALAALVAGAGLAPTAPVDGRRRARAGDPGGGERGDLALHSARHRQIGRHRPAGRHQGRAGRRSQDRQRGDPLLAPRLHDRRRRRADQHLFLRRRRQADRRLRHRGDARSQRRARRAQADACRTPTSASKASATASCCRAPPPAPPNRSRPTISPRGWSATAPRWSTASPCAGATRSCSR